MVQPIDYGVQIPDPTKAFLGAFETGASIQQAELKQQQQMQQMAQQRLIQEGFNKLRQPGATTQDVSNLAMILPKDQSESVLKAWALKTDKEKQEALRRGGKVVSALFAGENEIAQQYLNDQAVAMRNSGNEEGAKFLETWRGVTEVNPTASRNFFTAELLQLPGGDKIVENIIKLGGERRAEAEAPFKLSQAIAVADKAIADATTALATATNAPEKAAAESLLARAQADKAGIEAKYAEGVAKDAILKRAADLGLTNAQRGSALAQTNKLGIESKKAALELEALKATGGVDPTKTFEQEEKLRKEYQNRTKVYGELRSTFANIESSAKADSGPGDIALITSFMKMLDPGSVVRETEFATARDTAGLYSRLENALQKAQNGKFLNETQRKEYVDLAKQYLEASQKKAGEEKTALGVVVKNYKLNRDNVFGPETAVPATPSPNSVIVNGQTFNRPANFTDAQWSAYKQSVGAAP